MTTAPTTDQDVRLIRLMADLITVLESETAAVEAHLDAELPELVRHKQKLLVEYQAEFKALVQQPAILAGWPIPQQAALREHGRRLDATTKRNARIVGAAMTATQRLLQGIMSSVREETSQRRGYQHIVQPNAVMPTPSVLFNTTA